MRNVLCQNVPELAADQRLCLETLMGAPLRDDQQIVIMTLTPEGERTAENRSRAMQRVTDQLDAMAARQESAGVSIAEAESAADDAIEVIENAHRG